MNQEKIHKFLGKIMFDKFVIEDIDALLATDKEIFETMSGSSVLVTGSTGLLGSQIVLALLRANERYQLNIRIFILSRTQSKAEKIFGDKLDSLTLVIGDITDNIEIEAEIDYIIHGASTTNSLDFVNHPVDTINTVVHGTQNILEFAREKSVSGFVFLSSLEVYGSFSGRKDVSETDFGYLDPAQTRSSYSEGKRLAETLCVSYAHQYQLPIKIARLCQTFGPGVAYEDNRVFAHFARAIIEKTDIVLHTQGGTERNYCYIKDAISGIFHVLLRGDNAEGYNIANESTMISIKKMAELVSSLDDTGTVKVVIDAQDISKFGYNPEVKIRLLTSKLEALGWKPTTDLQTMFTRMILSMKEKGRTHE